MLLVGSRFALAGCPYLDDDNTLIPPNHPLPPGFKLDPGCKRPSVSLLATENETAKETGGIGVKLSPDLGKKEDTPRLGASETTAARHELGKKPHAPAGANVTQLSAKVGALFPGCTVDHLNWIGDGYCDHGDGVNYNTEACGWDGGDCCYPTCKLEARDWSCGTSLDTGDCKDPAAGGGGVDLPSFIDDLYFTSIGLQSSGGCCPTCYKELRQSDFNNGTLKITPPGDEVVYTSGCYKLMEDIEFNPSPMLPAADSPSYPLNEGWWLGFFAAVAISADNVFFNFNGYQIRQSKEHLHHQRFFSVIELADKPFTAEKGPPQFKKAEKTNEFKAAKNVIIYGGMGVVGHRGTMGLSSHHGIHGNDNENVWVHNMDVVDFEVGGLHFNGGSNIYVSQCDIGPSLGAVDGREKVPALATLSQANLLLRVADVDALADDAKDDPVFTTLQTTVDTFIQKSVNGDQDFTDDEKVFNDANEGFSGRPDGSAVYGLLFHKTGPAIHEFGACEQSQLADSIETTGKLPEAGVHVTSVRIHDLHLQSDEVIKAVANTGSILGPAGDVVQLTRNTNLCKGSTDACDPSAGTAQLSVLAAAQLKVAEYKDTACSDTGTAGETTEEKLARLFKAYGSTHIPKRIRDWMHGEHGSGTLSSAIAEADVHWECGGDAMSHKNKGAVGLRAEFLEDITLTHVSISGIKAFGGPSKFRSALCPTSIPNQYWQNKVSDGNYTAGDARGISVAFVRRVNVNTGVSVSEVTSANGQVHALFANQLTQDSGSPIHGESVSTNPTNLKIELGPDIKPKALPNASQRVPTGSFMHFSSSCEGDDQGVNLGVFNDDDPLGKTGSQKCTEAAKVEEENNGNCISHMYPKYWFNPGDLNSWGCRCCTRKSQNHPYWDMYRTPKANSCV